MKNPWKLLAAVSAAAFAVALAVACAPAVPPGPAACNNQPNMAAALASFDRARDWLARAEHNKGGWRDAAIASTESARSATIAGCQVADSR
ncbi:MAG: hypothetical protein ABSE49_19770 [Polyangiaceae bacterium]